MNIAGSFGAWISSPLVLLYGKYASLALAFGSFVAGINIMVGAKIGRIFIKAALFIFVTISISVILASAVSKATYIDAGLLGLAISKSLSELMNQYIIIGIFFLLLLLSLSSAMKLFRSMTYGLAKIIGLFILSPFQIFGLIFSSREEVLERGDILSLRSDEDNLMDAFGPKTEGEKFPPEAAEPDFLKNSHVQKNTNEFRLETGKAPSWLVDENGHLNVLAEINNQFEEEIKGKLSEQLDEQPQDIIESDLEQPDDIVGEEDYSQLARSRETEEDAFNDDLFSEVKEHGTYIFPDKTILEKGIESFSRAEENEEIERVSKIIENTFASFKIEIRVSGHSRGPAITRYEIVPPSGLKLKNIVNLTEDLALNLGTRNIRIVAPIGNKSIIGVEVPNRFRRTVVLREIIESPEFSRTKAKLPLLLGKDIAGNIVIEDLTEMPHLLIAGTTGSGKSVYVNSLIGGIAFNKTADEVKFIFIDPKMVELELYNGIPHLLAPVITKPEEAIAVLEWTSSEMDKRYKMLSDFGVRNMDDYNTEVRKGGPAEVKKGGTSFEYFPYIVIVIDEFANLMLRLPKETERLITRIAAMARAVGIHLVVATQRPSVDVVTGIIKANFPSRIAFRVSSQTDSRTILDKSGAEKLLGKGDMLFMTPNFTDMLRIQSPYVSNKDVETLVRELKRNGTADYFIDVENLMSAPVSEAGTSYNVDYRDDPLFSETLKAAVENGEISASYLQRRFRIGYNRASRLIDAMDRMRILGPSTTSSKPREVLIGIDEMNSLLNTRQQ